MQGQPQPQKKMNTMRIQSLIVLTLTVLVLSLLKVRQEKIEDNKELAETKAELKALKAE